MRDEDHKKLINLKSCTFSLLTWKFLLSYFIAEKGYKMGIWKFTIKVVTLKKILLYAA
jgi:hypothetical protein